MDELSKRAYALNQVQLSMAGEVFEADGATFVRNRTFPLRDVNRVTHVRAETPAEIGRLLARVEQEYAGLPFRVFHCGADTPPAFEARLLLDDYEAEKAALISVLEGPLLAKAKPVRIELIDDEAGWQAFKDLTVLDFMEYATKAGLTEGSETGEQLALINRAKVPQVRYWLAYVEERAVGFFSSWEGRDGLGMVEDLFVHPDFRHRGIATALLAHCVADSRAHGARGVVIVSASDDSPKQMYATMGFRPVAFNRAFRKSVT